MNIIIRNLLRLVRAGIYHDFESIEPMSPYKWRQITLYADRLHISDIIARGIRNFQYDHGNIPKIEINNNNQTTIAFDRMLEEAVADKQLSNALLNHKLQHIYEKEARAEEPSPETIQMLNLLIFNIASLLHNDISLPPLITTGLYLRRDGDMVDFIKLQSWIEHLDMQHLASLIGCLLTDTLGFTADEVPFITEKRPEASSLLEQNILIAVNNTSNSDDNNQPYFTQNNAGFVTASGQMVRRSLKTTLRYFTYSPILATGAFFNQLSRNLKDIEE